MATRGTIAKNYVGNKIIADFQDDFLGVVDKKIYLKIDDGGEIVPIAISLTCPKTAPFDITDAGAGASAGALTTSEITDEEKKNVHDLMMGLGLL